MPTRNDIAADLVQDHRPSGPDGASNCDRLAFVLEVFDVESIDLDGSFDFQSINACKDIDMVEACKHLCLLKIAYLKELPDYDLIDPVEADIGITYMTLTVQRINWHLSHLGMNRITPPFPGLN